MFRFGHATHPNWREALELVLVQLEGQMQLEQFAADITRPQKLGLIYVTEAFAPSMPLILQGLRQRTGYKDWVGGIAPGVCSSGVEYYQEPAIAAMLMEFPADSARVFSGKVPLPKPGTVNASGRDVMASALIHVDPLTEDIDDLLEDLSLKVSSNQVFGGLVSAGSAHTHVAIEPLSGGVSGVVFASGLPLEVRMTQGVQVVGVEHEITALRGNFVEELDGLPALDVLLTDLGLQPDTDESNSADHAADVLANRFAHVPFGARLLFDAANPRRITFRRGDCNEAILLDARWGDVPRRVREAWGDVPRRVGAAFFVFIGMGMQRWDKCGAMFVMARCDMLWARGEPHI